MMKRLLLIIVLLVCLVPITWSQSKVPLKQKAAQMLVVGFRDTILKKNNPICRDITELKIGGVILFDYDAPTKTRPRNIKSPKQLGKLTADLQKLAGGSLFISIDQEGGLVNRLKERNGFPPTRSAQYLGKLDNADTTLYWANLTAETLQNLNFNVNFAPDTDVDINPLSPAIGKVQRSFSANPQIVVKHNNIWIEQHNKYNIISAIKHFPGHGSAGADTHLGLVDVTKTWTEVELVPFQNLIDSGKIDMVMTSHIVNRKLDSVPATLSRVILTDLLRTKMGYNGIIISDDIAMGAIADYYPLEYAVEKAVNAGVDILILSNNGKVFDAKIALKVVNIICMLVEQGKIPQSRIDEAYNKIMSLKYKRGLTVNENDFTPHEYYIIKK